MGTDKHGLMTLRYEDVFSKLTALRPVYQYFDLQETSTVLDYGCGSGWTAVLLAQKVKAVYAIDISSGDIDKLKETVRINSINNVFPSVGDAEKLIFEDECFDFVFGNAVLHHLNLDSALSEVRRVLKKGGKAAFCEPYGHNPLMNLYRYLKDRYVDKITYTHWSLKCTDREVFEKYFSDVQVIETGFTSDRISSMRTLETKVLEKLPFVRKYASYITILLEK